jgi:pyruvate kinase
MLSAETAAGKHPIEAVKMMSDVIGFTEKAIKRKEV